VSVAKSFPVGAVMLLETGGETRFQLRGVEGVSPAPDPATAEQLILDGQHRLTASRTTQRRLADAWVDGV
jgi:hypothetical protein